MKLLIREFIPADGPAINAVRHAAAPGEPTVEGRIHRWVAKREGRLVAFGEYAEQADPGQFWRSFYVHPDHQRRGIGSALYAHLLSALQPFNPLAVRTSIQEANAPGARFLSARGFQVEHRLAWPPGRIGFVKWLKPEGDVGWIGQLPSTLKGP
ncbi:MAG: GNAT family N-acetyltransferase [Anaerolineales bacterium]